MKRATAGALVIWVLVGCVARPAPSVLPPTTTQDLRSASPRATGGAAPSTPPPSPASTPQRSSDATAPSGSGPTDQQLVAFPTAPPAAADWPTCTTFQLGMGGEDLGAGLGNAAAIVRMRNVSSDGCALEGYPDIRLLAPTGGELRTIVRRAVTGAYLFPAVRVQRVALGPGDSASFEIGYSDNPFGAGQNLPQDLACPVARGVRVILPGTNQFGTAVFPIAPCEGVVDVSPIFPGRDKLVFP